MPAKTTKLYVHRDQMVDLEFRNAYKQIDAAVSGGTKGPSGNPGPDGRDGVSQILTLKEVWQQGSTLRSFTEELPQFSFIMRIDATLTGWWGTDQTTPIVFELKDSTNTITYLQTTVDPTTVPNLNAVIRLWPTESFYTDSANDVWWGKVDLDGSRQLTFQAVDAPSGSDYVAIVVTYVIYERLDDVF